ncbi:hypothetical protein HHK36_021675 [Tetracentron sinense]|uniref:Uncharacterized protein n=1 Tax=Tetracentron sinense TaxID=13715 RepID=A0A834YVQ3_TETSI|nr:hypothetical protein HHK36_021675 [Tetracentron sinense]
MNERKVIVNQIGSIGDSVVAVFCNPFNAPLQTIVAAEKQIRSMGDLQAFSIVALLETIYRKRLSRILFKYLSEDHMLAVGLKSYAVASALENYEPNEKVDYASRSTLHGNSKANYREVGIKSNTWQNRERNKGPRQSVEEEWQQWLSDQSISVDRPLPLHHRHMVGASIQLQKAAKLLDSGAVRATRFLWQYPIARVILLFYLVFVHLFLMYLLHRLQEQADTFSSREVAESMGLMTPNLP